MGLTLDERLARFEPVHLGIDLSGLSEGDRHAIKQLAKVGHLFDTLYMRQAWSGNEALREKLKKSPDTKAARLFELFKGPWDRVEHDEPFLPSVPKRPAGGNFYPEDMTREEFESWLKTLNSKDRARAIGFYDVIRRDQQGHLQLRTYAEEYADILKPAAELLKNAAHNVSDETLKQFLISRADAFLSNDYLPSELDWLNISDQSPLEVTCGPYEVYTDGLFAYKAAYELYIHARDFASSELLSKFKDTLADVEKQLPVDNVYKNPDPRSTPIVVVNELFAAGDVAVPMTAAYNLPNDERAVTKGGSKLVIIKNVQEGKFEHILMPIARLVLAQEQLKHVSFEAFFTHILLHEVAHSNGPRYVAGRPGTTVRSCLQELYSTLEEAKADIVGLFAAGYLLRQGTISGISAESFYITYLASAFRSIRFGLNEAHGRGQAAQLNYLIDRGGFEYDEASGRFRVCMNHIEKAIRSLVHDIIVIQGDGNKARAQAFLDTFGINRDYTKAALARLSKVPIDIQPIYTTVN
jgi:hypothetical protein